MRKSSLSVIVGMLSVLLMLALACAPAARPTPTTAPARPAATAPAATMAPPTAAPTATPTVVAKVTPKGKVTVALGTLGEEFLDPHLMFTGGNYPIRYQLYRGLLWQGQDGKFKPAHIESWTVTPDGKVWNIRLRKGIKYHDGSEAKASDMAFIFQRFQRPAFARIPGPVDFLSLVEKIEVLGDYEARVTMKKTTPIFLERTAGSLMLIPEKYTSQVGDEQFNKAPVGSGPFKLAKHQKNEFVEFSPFPDYYEGTPTIESLTIRVAPEASTRLAMLETRAADIVQLSGPILKQVAATAGLRVAYSKSTGSGGINIWRLYDKSHPMSDLRVRQAMSYAIDRKAIVDKVLFGYGDPAVVHYWMPNMLGWDPNLKPYEYNPEKAKALLKEAGYEQGFEIKLGGYISGTIPDIPEQLQAVAGYWRAIGIKTEVYIQDSASYHQNWRERKHPDATVGYTIAQADMGGTLVNQLSSDGIWSPWKNPEFDKLVNDQDNAFDVKEREKILRKALLMQYEQLPTIPLTITSIAYGVADTIQEWPIGEAESYINTAHRIKVKAR